MSTRATRATIRFKDGDEEYFVYSIYSSPSEIFSRFLNDFIGEMSKSYLKPGCGELVSHFLGQTYDETLKLVDYKLTTGFKRGEKKYLVDWSDSEGWVVTLVLID